MPTSNTPKHDLRLIWDIKRRDGFGEPYEVFIAYVVYVTHEGVRNPQSTDYYGDREGLAQYANLSITAQRNCREGDNAWYGMSVEYRDVYSVSLRDAELMAKTLRRIGKSYERANERFGYTDDLAVYCARLADAIGVTDRRPYGHREKEITINGTPYSWTDVDGLRSAVTK